MNTIGEKIKQLRRNMGISQTELAESFGVSSQAVSKWESNVSQPDIALLPVIAAYFGVAIDDLFEYSRDKEFERIQNMVWNERYLSNEEFIKAERFLLTEIEKDSKNVNALQLLGDVYEFRGNNLKEKAAEYAKRVLALKPDSKNAHCLFYNNKGGNAIDWDFAHHEDIIEFYSEFIKINPDYPSGYLYLFDALSDDGRYEEAREVIAKREAIVQDSMNDYMRVRLVELQDGFEAALPKLKQLAVDYPENHIAWWNVGNDCGRYGHYEEAIEYIRKSYELEPKPRYTDAQECIAMAQIKLGRIDEAIATYEDELRVLREEWNVTFGEEYDAVVRKRDALKQSQK